MEAAVEQSRIIGLEWNDNEGAENERNKEPKKAFLNKRLGIAFLKGIVSPNSGQKEKERHMPIVHETDDEVRQLATFVRVEIDPACVKNTGGVKRHKQPDGYSAQPVNIMSSLYSVH